MATLEEQFAQRQAEAKQTYDQRQAENQALYDQRMQESRDLVGQREVNAQNQYNQREAEAQRLWNERQVNAQNSYAERMQEAQRLYDQRQAQAQSTYDQRQAEAQNTYDTRLSESQGRIEDIYAKALAAQQLQYKNALDQGIEAQEAARGGIAKAYQTAANDLAVQYERNKRNLNAQALTRGLNTGTGSQQQLALNQGYVGSYGRLRGEEAAQNAAIDRTIANLQVSYQNSISQAMADNDYKKAAALLDDYKDQLSWLDAQKMNNQNYLDTMTAGNMNRLDSMNDQNRSWLDSMTLNNQNGYDQARLNNQNRLDYLVESNQNLADTERRSNQSFLDSRNDSNRNRMDEVSDQNRNWLDTETRYQQQQALEKAETLASYGDFSGYASIYGTAQANAMREMWIAQNPLLAYNTGAIDAGRYMAMTGETPPGYVAPATSGGGGGGGGGSWSGSPSTSGSDGDGNDKGNGNSSYLSMIMKAKQAGASNAEISKAISADVKAGSTGDYKPAKGASQAQQSIDIRRATGTSINSR